jgi:hypothetical protein
MQNNLDCLIYVVYKMYMYKNYLWIMYKQILDFYLLEIDKDDVELCRLYDIK